MNEKTAPLQEGDLYVVKQGQLMHVEREGDLPKVPVSEEAKEALLQLRRRCRRVLGGFRPDVALVASALIQYAASLPQAETIVRDYDEAIRGSLRQPKASSLDSASC